MLRLLHWLSFRHAARTPLLALLAIAGIALGVGVFVAVRVASHTAFRSFQAAVDAVAGPANLEVVGSATGVPERLYPRVARAPGVEAATPLVMTQVPLADRPGEYVDLIGVDAFSNKRFRAYQVADTSFAAQRVFLEWIADPQGVLVPEVFAAARRLAVGDTLRILAATRVVGLRIHGLLRWQGEVGRTEQNLLIMDLAAVQELTGKLGRLDRIDLIVTDADRVARELAAELPLQVSVQRPARRSRQVEIMLDAFRLNLSALSLVALFVGMFLIYSAVTTSVVRRRSEIGVLRAIGLDRGRLRRLFLAEALVLGVLGVAAGIPLGLLLARLGSEAIASTVSALYVLVNVRQLFIDPTTLAVAMALGLGAVLVAAWVPAGEATRVEPRLVLAEGRYTWGAELRTGRLLGAAVLVLCAAAGAGLAASRVPPLGFASALLILTSAALASPALAAWLARLALPLARRLGAWARVAAQQFRASVGRAAVTVAALGSALTMVVALSTMITSFRSTVDAWVRQTIEADLYVQPAARPVSGNDATLEPAVVETLATLPGVRALDVYRGFTVEIGERLVDVAAVRLDVLARESRLLFRDGDPAAILGALGGGTARGVVISEPLARRAGLAAGDSLALATPGGTVRLGVAGVVRDYSSDAGLLYMDIELYRRLWRDPTVNNAALYLDGTVDLATVRATIRDRLGREHALIVRSPAEIRTLVLEVFDQTFAVTTALKLVTVIVALAGVFFTLSVQVAERQAEIGVLRALGATAAQIRAMILGEATLIGIASLLLGAVTGTALALLLTYVIMPSYFGWTVIWSWAPRVMVESLVVVTVASLLAAWLPARLAMAVEPADSLRAE
ncbi:MAG: FtsX-like permease family protein [Candidatus Eiseniibacteriota bacterium]|jgi:putative ABC transport system permease protein